MIVLAQAIAVGPFSTSSATSVEDRVQERLSRDMSQIQRITKVSHYFIDAELNTSTHLITANQTVEYFNNANISLKEVLFRMWANATQGLVKIYNVYDEDSQPLLYQMSEDTNLKVTLKKPVAPSTSTTMRIEFSLSTPNWEFRFGYTDTLHNLAGWYPIASVYDENGWDTSPYSFAGESFYSDVSNYDVNITVPAGQIVAANGELVNKVALPSDRVKWIWKAEMIREFVFSCSPFYRVTSVEINGLTISSYYFKEHVSRGLEAIQIAEKAIKTFSSLFAPYPSSTFSIAESNLGGYHGMIIAGMEYTGLILVDEYFYYYSSERTFETVLAHEVAHQWFSYRVGSDSYAEPWLDEGFATYSEVLYYEFVHGQSEGKQHLNEIRTSYSNWQQSKGDEALGQSMEIWEDYPNRYHSVVYFKGALVVNMLRSHVGNATFFRAMQTYFDRFSYRNAKIADLIEVFEETHGADLDWFFDDWVFQKGLPQYSVTVVFGDSNNLVLDVRQENAPKKMLVPFEIKYRGHSEIKTAWVNKTRQIIEFRVDEVPTGVIVDPENIILCAKKIRPLWDPVFRLIISGVTIGIIGLAISKKRKTLHPPPTSLDHFLEKELRKEGSNAPQENHGD